MSRTAWTALTDDQLRSQCETDLYRASGPGGQKRNKTSSAVRLRHLPSGLIVIAEESRSQHENRAKALQRLRRAFFLEVREPPCPDSPIWQTVVREEGRISVGRRDARFWPAAGIALDVLDTSAARVGEAAEKLGVSTGQLIDFLQTDPKLWQQANILRARHGQKPLH